MFNAKIYWKKKPNSISKQVSNAQFENDAMIPVAHSSSEMAVA